MKITNWFEEVKEQNIRMTTVQLGQVRQSIHLDGNTITVTLGRDSGIEQICPNGKFAMVIGGNPKLLSRTFSPLFQKYRGDFGNMLDNLKHQVDEIVNAVNSLFDAILDKDIPELMLERIAGEQMGSGPQELLKKASETRFKKLVAKLEGLNSPFLILNWRTDVGKKELFISFSSPKDFSLKWDTLEMHNKVKVFGVEPALTLCLLFLANYKDIEQAVDNFILAVAGAKAILG